MLTLLHPTILSAVREYPGGLLPVRLRKTGKLFLVIKTQKESILAARLKGGFSFYLAPLRSTSGLTVGLTTAFFEDHDEPLVVMTPLFDEPLGRDLVELLNYGEFEVYFFDELCREWMGHRAKVYDKGSLIAKGVDFILLTYHPKTLDSTYENLKSWFGNRTAEDDANAIKVILGEELFPSDILISDLRPENHDFYGSGGFSHSLLQRENPGYFQERDIVTALKCAFRGEQLAINPKRRDNGKEFVDVLAVSDTHLLLVQAKDSPNTETSLARTIDRKRRSSHSQIQKGMRQAKGATAYAAGRTNVELIIDKVHFDIDVDCKKIISLVVVQEMFTDEGDAFVIRYREMEGLGHLFVLLDYAAFSYFCYHFQTEKLLIGALTDYNAKILSGGFWIDPHNYILELTQKKLRNL